MSERNPARPPQVTLAGWMVMAGSVLVVLLAFDQVGELRSLETREAVEEYLSKPPGDSLGIGVQGVLGLMRVATMVAAACAAAAAILGFQVLRRSKGARVALSVIALPLFVSGMVTGGIVSAVVVAAIVMLWFQPARGWLDGRAPAPRPEFPTATPPEPSPPDDNVPASPAPYAGSPDSSAGGRDPLLDLPPPTSPPLHPTPYGTLPAAPPTAVPGARGVLGADRRPRAVVWACALTWLSASAAFLALGATLVLMLAQPETLLDEAHRQNPELADQGITDAMLRTTVYVTSAVVMVWSVAAAVLAVLTWRRVRWAGTALLISAAVAGGACLLVVVGSLVLLLPLAACAATVVLLLRPEARRWLAGPTS